MLKTKETKFIIVLYLLLLSPLSICTAFGDTAETTPPPAVVESHHGAGDKLTALESITRTVEILRKDIEKQQKSLQIAETADQKSRIISEINKLSERLGALERDYEDIATGIDLDLFTTPARKGFDWQEEIDELLGPIIQEMKSITARPRAIEKLRSEIAYYEKRLPLAQEAEENVRRLAAEAGEGKPREELKELHRKWGNLAERLASQLAVTKYQFNEKLGEKRSFLESAQEIAKIFFKSRGKNLLLALLAFFTAFMLLRAFHSVVVRISPLHKAEKRSYFVRFADLLYHLFTFIGAVTAMLAVLYVAGDWVLLGIALLFLFGVAWAARMGLPRFWEQCKLLLNLGTVREMERVVYNGIPWRVDSLRLYTTLVNPELKGGMIRLPIRELMDLHSRPYEHDEPWFPSKEKEWVILTDGTIGKVATQTPEMVQLVLKGGSRKTYTTKAFLNLSPDNISTDFRICSTFGIDYRHQAISTREVPDKLKESLLEGLTSAGHGDNIINLDVEFKEAGSSSLDVEVLADFSGRAAKDYDILARAIQRIAVDACNRYGWIIPFTQITLHTGESRRQET